MMCQVSSEMARNYFGVILTNQLQSVRNEEKLQHKTEWNPYINDFMNSFEFVIV